MDLHIVLEKVGKHFPHYRKYIEPAAHVNNDYYTTADQFMQTWKEALREAD